MIGTKLDMILDRCRGKKVLDIGCVEILSDFRPENLKNNQFVKIASVAAECVGIDLEEEGVKALRKMGYNVHCCFAEEAIGLGLGEFDVIILGDIIEHIPDPNSFLKSLRPLLKVSGEIVCTTPNALSYANPLFIAANKRLTRHQHVCWYCRVTLENTFKLAGYSLNEMHFCSYAQTGKNPLRRLSDKLASFREELSPHLFGVFVPAESNTKTLQKSRIFS